MEIQEGSGKVCLQSQETNLGLDVKMEMRWSECEMHQYKKLTT